MEQMRLAYIKEKVMIVILKMKMKMIGQMIFFESDEGKENG